MQTLPRSHASLQAELYVRAYWRVYLFTLVWVLGTYSLLEAAGPGVFGVLA